MTSLATETSRSLTHMLAVVRRWWLLIAIVTLIAVSFGGLASVGSSTHYVADAQVLLTQPNQTLRPGNDTAVRRLSELQNTVARLVSSDAVLDGIRQAGVTTRSVAELRGRVSGTADRNSLIVLIHTDFPTASEAERVAVSAADQLSSRLGVLGATEANDGLVLVPVQAPVVGKISGNVARTVFLSLVFGLGFSLLAAFALDRS